MALLGSEVRRSWLAGVTDADGRRVGIDAGGIADSIGAALSVAAPTAGTNVGFLTVVSGVTYRVRVTVALTGTAETALANCSFKQNGVTVSSLPSLTGQAIPFEFPRVTTTGTSLVVTAIANAVAGSIYTTHISATRVE